MNKVAKFGFLPEGEFETRAIEFDHRITESKQVSELSLENEHLRSLLAEAQSLKNRNKEELIKLREDKMDLELEIEELKDVVLNQTSGPQENAQLKAFKERVQLLEVTLGQLRKDKSVLINKVEDSNRKAFTFEARANKAEAALQEAVLQQDHIRASLADRNERLQSISQEKSEESQKVQRLESELKRAEDELAELKQSQQSLKEDVLEQAPLVTGQLSGMLETMSVQMEAFQSLVDQATDMGDEWRGLMATNQGCTKTMEELIEKQANMEIKPAETGGHAKWNPVANTLPEQSGVYLLTDGNRQCVGYFNSQAQSFSSTTLFESPSHWMKQPELP